MRPRASSYDAPHQTSPPNQPGKLAALAQVIPSNDQVDGVATHTPTSARLDTQADSTDSFARATGDNFSPASPPGNGGSGHNMPYSNASFNTSAPILSNLSSAPMTARAMTGPQMKRRISFAHNLSVHTTWAGNIYDRRGEPATCNKLTPQLAQRIKEELNAFKMEEMEVVSTSLLFCLESRLTRYLPAPHESQPYALLRLNDPRKQAQRKNRLDFRTITLEQQYTSNQYHWHNIDLRIKWHRTPHELYLKSSI